MGGGLMQLVAYGAQDIYLTGNPQITFFKVVYRRHTNFSMEHIQQTFKGTPGSGARVVATVSRNGDLIHDCYIKFNCNQLGTDGEGINNPGHALINNVEVEIGGQSIDKQYGHFMEAHAELTEKNYTKQKLKVHSIILEHSITSKIVERGGSIEDIRLKIKRNFLENMTFLFYKLQYSLKWRLQKYLKL